MDLWILDRLLNVKLLLVLSLPISCKQCSRPHSSHQSLCPSLAWLPEYTTESWTFVWYTIQKRHNFVCEFWLNKSSHYFLSTKQKTSFTWMCSLFICFLSLAHCHFLLFSKLKSKYKTFSENIHFSFFTQCSECSFKELFSGSHSVHFFNCSLSPSCVNLKESF